MTISPERVPAQRTAPAADWEIAGRVIDALASPGFTRSLAVSCWAGTSTFDTDAQDTIDDALRDVADAIHLRANDADIAAAARRLVRALHDGADLGAPR